MRIDALVATSSPSRRIHHSGFPHELGAGSPRRTLPAARFLTIELTAEGFFLFRFAEDGVFAGRWRFIEVTLPFCSQGGHSIYRYQKG